MQYGGLPYSERANLAGGRIPSRTAQFSRLASVAGRFADTIATLFLVARGRPIVPPVPAIYFHSEDRLLLAADTLIASRGNLINRSWRRLRLHLGCRFV